MDATSAIKRYIRSTSYDDLPNDVVEVAKKAVVDTVGAAIAGNSFTLGKLVDNMVRDWVGQKGTQRWQPTQFSSRLFTSSSSAS
ncbi:MmgE/PrpD family protein [Chloroflexota bacterium]